MFSNRPLFPTAADRRFYAAGPEAKQFQHSMNVGQNALLIGERGSGKSTTLRMTEMALRSSDQRAVYVSFAQAETLNQALAAVHRAANSDDVDDFEDLPMRDDPHSSVTLVRRLGGAHSMRFIVDDVTADIGHALFGRLRDELWQLTHTWGVAVDTNEAHGLVTPPADAFFERRIRLEPLDDYRRLELLKRRNEHGIDSLSASQIEVLAANGPGNPRQLVAYAREVAEQGSGSNPQALLAAVDRRRRVAEGLAGRGGGMVVTEMEGLGPVSASDQRLLDALGWTRPRAAGVLGELEEGGVVISYPERSDGPGRPRKVYELIPPEAFEDV